MAGYLCALPRLVPPIAAMRLPCAALLNGLASDGSLTHTATDLQSNVLVHRDNEVPEPTSIDNGLCLQSSESEMNQPIEMPPH